MMYIDDCLRSITEYMASAVMTSQDVTSRMLPPTPCSVPVINIDNCLRSVTKMHRISSDCDVMCVGHTKP